MSTESDSPVDKMGLALKYWILLCVTGCQADTGYFWHVTDFHYDHSYWTSQLSCNQPVTSPGQFGDYWCDSPWRLVQDAITNMKAIKPDVDFVIWTGDTVAHISDHNLSLALNLEIVQNVTSALDAAFPHVPVYASLGNHDFYPSNQANYSRSEIYETVESFWQHWIQNRSGENRFAEGGFYSASLSSRLLLLALNTNLYYTSNKLTSHLDDPAGQLAWMRTQLDRARQRGQKVIITGHVPPGLITPGLTDWFYPRHKSGFLAILLNYADVIVATHFGHDHTDGFKILQDETGDRAVPQFTAPSVTPWRYKSATLTTPAHNPGIRLVEYDRMTGTHWTYHQYFINISDSNQRKSSNWTQLYDFRQSYNVPDMGVSSLQDILARLGRDHKERVYTDRYCTFSLVSNLPIACTDRQRAEIYCGGTFYQMERALNCTQDYLRGGASSPHHSWVVAVGAGLIVLMTVVWV